MSYRPHIRYHRSDSNQQDMVDTLRRLGCSVHVLNNVVDLMVGYAGVTMLAEVRPIDSKPKPRKGRQKKFHDSWTGGVYWLQTTEDCQELAKTLRRWQAAIMASGVPF